ncbi:hypothetical protein [Actinoplanes campanulatus]|uniref:hypothetical protein n=1 Tax=Actinoplanes campanulatus TaxID=113559 RepID=UPI0019539BED|nr:hypothetical protein [Actinoplanes capillaceus]
MLPAARTRDEAHLYMDLHGCPDCMAVEVPWSESLVEEDGVPARSYHGRCDGCGRERRFVFALPRRPTPPRAGATVTFGADEETSVLFDPGEWVEIADMMALAAELPDITAEEAREWRATAAACLGEALKFVPSGEAAVPGDAFWSVPGRALRDRAPNRFRRSDLEARRAALGSRT